MTQQERGTSSTVEVQEALTAATIAAVERFCAAFNKHDLDAAMAAMTDDCVLETLGPYPDGTRYEGQTAVRARWEEAFSAYPDLWYETEELFAVGDRCVLRSVAHRTDKDGEPEHHRGVDIFRVRDGKLAEKFFYTKRRDPTRPAITHSRGSR